MMNDRVSPICQYYSSDEDVAWGPLTEREIRREFLKPTKSKAISRRTDFPSYKEHQKMITPTDSTLSSNAEYCTANETGESDFNLREKKITGLDQTCSNPPDKFISSPKRTSDKYEQLDADNIVVLSSDEDEEVLGTFHIKSEFENSANIDIISLSSSSREGSSDGEVYVIDADIEEFCQDKSDISEETNGVNQVSTNFTALNVSQHSRHSPRKSNYRAYLPTNEFIITGITPLEFISKHSPEFQKMKNVRSSASPVSENHRYELNDNNSCGSSNYPNNDLNENFAMNRSETTPAKLTEELVENFEKSSDSSSGVDENHEYEFNNDEASRNSDSAIHVDNFDMNKSIGGTSSKGSSKLQNSSKLGNSHVYEFDDCEYPEKPDSANSSRSKFSESLSFNDTLAEMENLLANDSESENDFQAIMERSVEDERDFSDRHTQEPISRIPVPLVSNENENKDNFKIPLKPSKSVRKSPLVDKKLTPRKVSPNRFKDIISPVRMYINNSALPILKQNHTPLVKKYPLGLFSERAVYQVKTHRNLVSSFPEVIYKPSKQCREQFDSEIILPHNIRKLMKERTVIKHEVRTRVNFNESEILTSEELKRADLSCVMSDEKNMSLHTAKQGFNI